MQVQMTEESQIGERQRHPQQHRRPLAACKSFSKDNLILLPNEPDFHTPATRVSTSQATSSAVGTGTAVGLRYATNSRPLTMSSNSTLTFPHSTAHSSLIQQKLSTTISSSFNSPLKQATILRAPRSEMNDFKLSPPIARDSNNNNNINYSNGSSNNIFYQTIKSQPTRHSPNDSLLQMKDFFFPSLSSNNNNNNHNPANTSSNGLSSSGLAQTQASHSNTLTSSFLNHSAHKGHHHSASKSSLIGSTSTYMQIQPQQQQSNIFHASQPHQQHKPSHQQPATLSSQQQQQQQHFRCTSMNMNNQLTIPSSQLLHNHHLFSKQQSQHQQQQSQQSYHRNQQQQQQQQPQSQSFGTSYKATPSMKTITTHVNTDQPLQAKQGGRILTMLRTTTRGATAASVTTMPSKASQATIGGGTTAMPSMATIMSTTMDTWSPNRVLRTESRNKSYQPSLRFIETLPVEDGPATTTTTTTQPITQTKSSRQIESSTHIKVLPYQTSYAQLPPSFVQQVNQMKRAVSKSSLSDPEQTPDDPEEQQQQQYNYETNSTTTSNNNNNNNNNTLNQYNSNTSSSSSSNQGSSNGNGHRSLLKHLTQSSADFHQRKVNHSITMVPQTVSRFGSSRQIRIPTPESDSQQREGNNTASAATAGRSFETAENNNNNNPQNNRQLVPQQSASSLQLNNTNNQNEKKKVVQFQFEQTNEQKRFQSDLLSRIRHKLKSKNSLAQFNSSEDAETAAAAAESHIDLILSESNDPNTFSPILSQDLKSTNSTSASSSNGPNISATTTNSANSKEVLPESKQKQQLPQQQQQKPSIDVTQAGKQFVVALKNEIQGNPLSSISRSYAFFLCDVDLTYFLQGMNYLFSSALTSAIAKNTSNLPFKFYNFKIPQNLFFKISMLLRNTVLQDMLRVDYLTLCHFESLSLAQYEHMNLKPLDFLEEIGGKKRCEAFIQDVYAILQQNIPIISQTKLPEKQILDLGIALLTNNIEAVEEFMAPHSTTQSPSLTPADLCTIKFHLYKYIWIQKQGIFEEITKLEMLRKFENFRYKYFVPCAQMNTEPMSREILKYLSTKKPLLDYFQDENQQTKVSMFVFQMMEYLFSKADPISIIYWLKKNTKKQVDESFFLQFKPLFMEHFRLNNIRADFIQNIELKFFWVKLHLGGIVAFDGSEILSRTDEFILNMQRWVEGMIAQNQLTKQQLARMPCVTDTSFLAYFIKCLFNDDCLYAGETLLMLDAFHTSLDSVQFQLKGLKRIFLLMRIKTHVAYEMAEFITKAFNQSIYPVLPC